MVMLQQKNRFKYLHEDCQVLFLLEFALIAGDIYYMIVENFELAFIYARLFFLVCSTFNFFAVVYIMWKYDMWGLTYHGDMTEGDDDNTKVSLHFRPTLDEALLTPHKTLYNEEQSEAPRNSEGSLGPRLSKTKLVHND